MESFETLAKYFSYGKYSSDRTVYTFSMNSKIKNIKILDCDDTLGLILYGDDDNIDGRVIYDINNSRYRYPNIDCLDYPFDISNNILYTRNGEYIKLTNFELKKILKLFYNCGVTDIRTSKRMLLIINDMHPIDEYFFPNLYQSLYNPRSIKDIKFEFYAKN